MVRHGDLRGPLLAWLSLTVTVTCPSPQYFTDSIDTVVPVGGWASARLTQTEVAARIASTATQESHFRFRHVMLRSRKDMECDT
jgi:hypothetical protein